MNDILLLSECKGFRRKSYFELSLWFSNNKHCMYCDKCILKLPIYNFGILLKEKMTNSMEKEWDVLLWKECQKSKDPNAALQLVKLMEEISERCMCAGWLSGLEYSLWSLIQGFVPSCQSVNPVAHKWGQDALSATDMERLQSLSRQCNSWWIWDNNSEIGHTLISLEEWQPKYECVKAFIDVLLR